jgi:hypothetical protein
VKQGEVHCGLEPGSEGLPNSRNPGSPWIQGGVETRPTLASASKASAGFRLPIVEVVGVARVVRHADDHEPVHSRAPY